MQGKRLASDHHLATALGDEAKPVPLAVCPPSLSYKRGLRLVRNLHGGGRFILQLGEAGAGTDVKVS